jgi:hypothetical protein
LGWAPHENYSRQVLRISDEHPPLQDALSFHSMGYMDDFSEILPSGAVHNPFHSAFAAAVPVFQGGHFSHTQPINLWELRGPQHPNGWRQNAAADGPARPGSRGTTSTTVPPASDGAEEALIKERVAHQTAVSALLQQVGELRAAQERQIQEHLVTLQSLRKDFERGKKRFLAEVKEEILSMRGEAYSEGYAHGVQQLHAASYS